MRVTAAWSVPRSCVVSPNAGCDVITAGRDEVDLERQDQAERFLTATKPDVVVVAAAKVGGIHANNAYPAEFIAKNLAIALNAIHGSYKAGVKKLLFLGSSCIYPKFARQPMSEEELLTGPLEPTNEWYAVAKIAGIKLCQAYRRQYGADFISLMPTNLYGPGDNYHPDNSHVVAALDPAPPSVETGWRPDCDGVGYRHAAPRIPFRG